jgi:7,8-didemethyl-8-hydroxy-5-deazariboflavin synthase CofH subunit
MSQLPSLFAIRDHKELSSLLSRATPRIGAILETALAGNEISRDEGIALFKTHGVDRDALLAAANDVRVRRSGDRVSFVQVRNINFTNVCYMGCRFCNFARRKEASDAEFLTLAQVADRAEEAWLRGATEVCIQGGLHPDLSGDHYRKIVEAVKARTPGMHLHAFSPFEIWYGARKSRMTVREFLVDLRAAGLGTVPGTAAEILDTEVRLELTRNKLSAADWERIIREAHSVGLRSTATIMYGHIDAPHHWAAHIDRIRNIQRETGGFTEFVPLGFIHYETELFRVNAATRPGPTDDENLKMHAVARLMLQGHIDNIQVSWVKLGPQMAQAILACGANDLGGTLMNESISRAAGAKHGQEITPAEMVRIIRAAGRVPVQRDTLYGTVEVFDSHDPCEIAPLVVRKSGASPTAFLDAHTAVASSVAK